MAEPAVGHGFGRSILRSHKQGVENVRFLERAIVNTQYAYAPY